MMKANWDEQRLEQAQLRAYWERWSKTAKARVTHPVFGSVIVPCGSCFASILCAADIWNVPFVSLLDARVEDCDQSLPVEMPEV